MRRTVIAFLRRAAAVPLLATALALSACAGTGSAGGPGGRAEASTDSAPPASERARREAVDRRVVRGRALLAEGEPRRAAGVLERAVRIDPSHGEAYLALARARLALGDEARARGLLDRAVELLRAGDSPAAARADSLRDELDEGR